jgi:hypothetical protein
MLDFMNPAEKGRRYAKIFRKAGVHLGKGNIPRAIEVLKEGEALAKELGDLAMARRFAAEIERATRDAESSS